jgi:hypothetical protein
MFFINFKTDIFQIADDATIPMKFFPILNVKIYDVLFSVHNVFYEVPPFL